MSKNKSENEIDSAYRLRQQMKIRNEWRRKSLEEQYLSELKLEPKPTLHLDPGGKRKSRARTDAVTYKNKRTEPKVARPDLGHETRTEKRNLPQIRRAHKPSKKNWESSYAARSSSRAQAEPGPGGVQREKKTDVQTETVAGRELLQRRICSSLFTRSKDRGLEHGPRSAPSDEIDLSAEIKPGRGILSRDE
jgi:hypothetical protein